MWPCTVTNFFIIKPIRFTNFTNLFWHEILHVSDSSSVHHQEFIHYTLSHGIYDTAFEQDQDGTAVPSWSCSKAVYKPVWHIPLMSVQWINSLWWTDELSETCRVSCQNKFVKLVHLVGFIIKKRDRTFFPIFYNAKVFFLTRDTHLMQQFIYYYKQLYIFRASKCPSSGVIGCIRIILLHMVSSTRCCGWGSEEPVCSLVHWCKFCIRQSDTKLTPVHKTTHQLLRTSATTPSAGHHME